MISRDLLILLVLLAVGFNVHANALDCRKFVFAPVCRGIIAKRAMFQEIKRNSPRDTWRENELPDNSYMSNMLNSDATPYREYNRFTNPNQELRSTMPHTKAQISYDDNLAIMNDGRI